MAGFNTAVTGLKSSSTLLDVAGNNIANSSTVGFKATRTEFADIFATSVVGAGASNQPGSGVTVSDTSQDFSAGTIEFTNNNLDLAINGSGFFQLNDGQGGITYTRAGAFELDKDGFIVSKNGKYLQGYGLDAQENQLPLQNLSVTQKESPPHATETIDLSFNIDASADATKLSRTFDKTNPASYTYSTTVETVDSLGNSNSIRFYAVEQAPWREDHRYNIGSAQDITLSGIVIPATQLSNLPEYITGDAVRLASFLAADERIDPASLQFDATSNVLRFESFSQFTGYGDYVVQDASGANIDPLPGYPEERKANEVRSYTFAPSGTEIFDNDGKVTESLTITIGDVDIPVSANTTKTALGELIENAGTEIIDKNPLIESVAYKGSDIIVTWKAEAGAIEDTLFSVSATSSGGLDVFTQASTYSSKVIGDSSYNGNYRFYAYLNDDTALNIGKQRDPGESSGTEVGPVIVSFDTTSGVLSSVNRIDATAGNATPIQVFGADPANPDDALVSNDIDGKRGIQLDLTGSSQFASESIVKAATQDGYPKGDLIGVTFAETGQMVASFSNGQRQNLGLVAIASFENQSGLLSSGNSEWIATLNSGSAILNPPGTGLNGTLRSAALEQSNVDLSAELVKLIEGQRNFQANSKTLETMNTVTQAILQI